jgi:hypothetical protein
VDYYRDDLLHLNHPPSSQVRGEGHNVNDIPPLSWPADSRIGALPGIG